MKNKKGFTLVELLAVIIILGVLLLVAVPGITSLINQSKQRTFASTAKLAINDVEDAALLEAQIEGIAAPGCYVPLEKIKLSRGSFGKNYSGYVLIGVDGKGKIYYANNEYYVENGTADSATAKKQPASKINYSAAPTYEVTAENGTKSNVNYSVCTWY